MQHQAYKSIFLIASTNQTLTKQLTFLSKLTTITYPDKSTSTTPSTTSTSTSTLNPKQKQKKFKCWICQRTYDHIFMLVVHVEILHVNVVDKYLVKNQAVFVVLKDRYKDRGSQEVVANGYIVGLVKNTSRGQGGYVNAVSKTHSFVNLNPAHLKQKLQSRLKQILNSILQKFQQNQAPKQPIYFHSTNIFKKITASQDGQNSEDELGEVEKELEKLRIEDFSDVNDNDKKFFIQWNGFIHQKRKKLSIIYAHDMADLFVEFAGIADAKGIPRINLVMHAWTLWSVGQITANDVVRGLEQFDQSSQNASNSGKAPSHPNQMQAQN